jgi:anti-anti-sigma regulatory factor
VVLDHSDVEYIGASGITALLFARAIGEERGRPVVIRNHPEHAAGVLGDAGLLDLAV